MANYTIAIIDEGTTGAIFAFDIVTSSNGRMVTVRQDNDYSNTRDARTSRVAINFASRDGNSVNTGAVWDELRGDGVDFAWPDFGLEVDMILYGRQSGVFTRDTGIPASQPQRVNIAGGEQVASMLIGNDGFIQPNSAQHADWVTEFRPVQADSAFVSRYTNIEQVRANASVPDADDDESSAWSADGELTYEMETCILSAEQLIDELCGHTFDAASAASSVRSFYTNNTTFLETDPYAEVPTMVEVSGSPLSGWRRYIAPTSVKAGSGLEGRFPIGTKIDVTARWGWPRVPYPIVQAATLAASRLFYRSRSPMGIELYGVGETELALYTPRNDADFNQLLSPYMALGVIG